jgi:hypothetical protein
LIIVQNHYYPVAGERDAVLATRLAADACRRRLGLPAGRTLALAEGPDDAPAVIWQAAFVSLRDWHDDLRVLAASPEFTAIRREQSAQLRGFSRCGYALAGDEDSRDASG